MSDLAQFRKPHTISLYRTDVIAHGHTHFLSYIQTLQAIVQIEAPRHGQLDQHPSQEDDYLSVRLGTTGLRNSHF